MKELLNTTYPSSLTDICELNSSFDKGTLRICYPGTNRNGSEISRDAIEKSISTIYNCPVVCNYDRETDTLGGHDIELVSDSNGYLRVINTTTPIGVIPESAEVWFDDYTEDDGTIHTYLYSEVLLWKRQEAYKKIKDDGITAQSMEIRVTAGNQDENGIYKIDEFEFTAFALIGETPCFESASLETFSALSQTVFQRQLEQMKEDLKNTFSLANTSKVSDKDFTEGGINSLNEKKELAAKYNVDIDGLDFSIEDFSLEELEAKFKSLTDAVEGPMNTESNFSLISNVKKEACNQVRDIEIMKNCWGEDVPRYTYVDLDMDRKMVYVEDRADHWNLYGMEFELDGDVVAIKAETKKRQKYTIVDFEEGQSDPLPQIFELIETESSTHKVIFDELNEKFSTAQNTIASYEQELNELRAFKQNTENAVAEEARSELFSKFSDLEGLEDFETLKRTASEYSLEILEEKCFAVRGKNTNTQLNFAAIKDPATPKLVVDRTPIEKTPYGGIVEKYGVID